MAPARKIAKRRKRRPNPRLVKTHICYTVDEAAKVCCVHKNTFRAWFKGGLEKIDSQRPCLIHGATLRAFLEQKRTSKKQPCKPGQLYCLRCRVPQWPAENMAEFKPITAKFGSLCALCPVCTALMNQSIKTERLKLFPPEIEVTLTNGQTHISKCASPSLNSDFKTGESNYA